MAPSTPEDGLPDPGGQPQGGWPRLPQALAGARKRAQRDDVPSLAASIAFRIFLSLFPAAAAAIAVFSLVTDPVALVDRLAGVVPEAALNLLERQFGNLQSNAGGVAVAGLAGGLWAASSAAATLIKGLNRVYNVGESRSFVRQRGTALLLTVALFLALAALIALVVLGPQLRELLLPEQVFGVFARWPFLAGQIVAALAILVLLFAFVYWAGPNRGQARWQWLSPGSVLAVVGWLVLSGAFTLYTRMAADYEATYSSLAGVVVTMLWLQLSMAVLLLGAEVDAELVRMRQLDRELQLAAGVGFQEPTTEPLTGSNIRPGLPRPAHGRTGVGRAAVAAGVAVVVATGALLSAARGRGSGRTPLQRRGTGGARGRG